MGEHLFAKGSWARGKKHIKKCVSNAKMPSVTKITYFIYFVYRLGVEKEGA